MSYKYEGKRYDRSLSLKEIAQKVREYAKTDEVLGQCKWSITTHYASMCQELNITLMEAPFEAFTDTYRDYNQWSKYYDSEDQNGCTKETNEVMCRMRDYVESYNYEDSDIYTDYFHVNFYTDYAIGKYDKPFKKVEKRVRTPKPVDNEPVEGLRLVEYSEKSIAVIGETKPLKELLKKLGGKFNSRLNLPCKCGWIFPKTSEETIRLFLNIDRAM